MKHSFEIELRQAENREPELHGTMLTEGRAASGGRAELFTPGSVSWPTQGVEIAPSHVLPSEVRAHPVRQADGRLTLKTRATPALQQAVEGGARHMSIEFHAMKERRTQGGVREILSALVIRAALEKTPEYDTTAVEIRGREQAIIERARAWL